MWTLQNFKDHFEKHLPTVASDSSYILHKKLNTIIQEPDWPSVSFWNIKSLYFTYCRSYSFVLSLAVIHCHFLLLVVIRCYSLSFIVTHCTTRCHSLSLVVPVVVVTFVPIAYLFINDLISNFKNYFYKAFTKLSFSTHFLFTLTCRLIYTCSRIIFLILSQNNMLWIVCAEEIKIECFCMIEFIFKTSTLLKKALWRRCFPVNFTIIVPPSDCLCESNHEQMSILPPF